MRVKNYHPLRLQAVTIHRRNANHPVRIDNKEAQPIMGVLEIEPAPHIVERLTLHGAGHPGCGAGLNEEGENE